MFVCVIEVQSYSIRVQSEETWCDSISRLQCGLSYVCALFSDDGEKKDINDLSNVVCWVSTLCNDLTSRQGFVRLLSEFVSTGVISSEVSWRTFGTRYIFPHLLCLAACERTQRVIPSVSSDSKEVIDYIR